ncbi:hypothetical protein ANCCAN_26215 [Ancylostoma caninum]|nr:hypothetical protein ANCCAN_26215 [Ancylostoma caninum]
MEIILNNPKILVYFVDLSNLLVVINGTANFFCYLCFGASFRHTLKKILSGFWKEKPKLIWTMNGNEKIPDSHHTLL